MAQGSAAWRVHLLFISLFPEPGFLGGQGEVDFVEICRTRAKVNVQTSLKTEQLLFFKFHVFIILHT